MATENQKLLVLMAAQLKQFGYFSAAKTIQDSINVKIEPSNQLQEMCKDLQFGQEEGIVDSAVEKEFDPTQATKKAPAMSTNFSTQHRGSCRAAAFSLDGNLLATGSQDTSLKVLDVAAINRKGDEDKRVIKTLYDHSQAVNEVCFHPNGVVLASCSDDFNIKLYDLQKPNSKKAFRYLPDAYPVRSISFHPSGEYMISATDHHAVRLFDIQTMKVYIQPNTSDHHNGAITKVRFAPNGSTFASASVDGSIKIFDTVTGRCVNTIQKAHGGASVTSVEYAANSTQILSTGLDSKGQLWDLSNGKVLQTYAGAEQKFDQAPMVFNYNQDFVVGTDCSNDSIVMWDFNTGEIARRIRGVSDNPLRVIVTSPTDHGFVTGGDDCRARYWNVKD